MADLEQTATEALDKLRSLTALTDKAHERLAELAEEIQEAGERVETDWSAFVEKGEALLEVAEEAGRRVGTAGADAQGDVSTLQAQVAQADTDFDGALGSASEGILELGRGFTGAVPEAATLRESVERTTDALTAAADEVEGALREAVEAARAFVQDVVAEGLGELREHVAERTQQLGAMATASVEAMQESFTGWDQGLAAVESKVTAAFEETRDHMAGLVDVAIRFSNEAFLDPLKEVEGQVESLEQLLAEVGTAVEESAEEAVAPSGERLAAMEEDRVALEAVRSKLDEVKALLASFTFVEM